MYTPKHNWILFGVFSLFAVSLFITTLFSPLIRSYTKAPLRDLLLPPPTPIELNIVYSTEKEEWINEAVERFNDLHKTVNGHPIQINLSETGSREMYIDILDGNSKPVMISPASNLQINILDQLSRAKFGTSIIPASRDGQCESVFSTPLVVAAWSDRAEVLWGNRPSINIWKQIHDAEVDPQGWQTLGHPEWGYVKFGHTNPLKSNSGFMTLLLMTYSYYGKTSGLTESDILANPAYQAWILELENSISSFGDSTGTYMKEIIAYGPSMYDMVAVYEATAIENLQNAAGRYGELKLYYPPATILSDHPFCILNADWVSDEQAQAAKIFLDYLLSPEIQQLALDKYGFRPVDPAIPLDSPTSPLSIYKNNGVQVTLPPQVEIPDGNTLNTLLEFWSRNVQP